MEISTLKLVEIVNYIYAISDPNKIGILETILDQTPAETNYLIEIGLHSKYGIVRSVTNLYPRQFQTSRIKLRYHIKINNLISECRLRLTRIQVETLNELLSPLHK